MIIKFHTITKILMIDWEKLNFFNKIYEFKNFNCSAKELKKQLEKLSKFL